MMKELKENLSWILYNAMYIIYRARNFRSPPPVINTRETKSKVEKGDNVKILDVRRPSEYVKGHIPNAILIPLDELGKKARATLNPKEEIITVCNSGPRSRVGFMILKRQGFKKVKFMGGGTKDWKKQGFKIAKGRG